MHESCDWHGRSFNQSKSYSTIRQLFCSAAQCYYNWNYEILFSYINRSSCRLFVRHTYHCMWMCVCGCWMWMNAVFFFTIFKCFVLVVCFYLENFGWSNFVLPFKRFNWRWAIQCDCVCYSMLNEWMNKYSHNDNQNYWMCFGWLPLFVFNFADLFVAQVGETNHVFSNRNCD